MSKRKILKEADPKAFETMMGFERYLARHHFFYKGRTGHFGLS